MSLPSTSASLRGFTSTCVCIDEAAYVWHLDEILQAIGPTLTRDPDAELVFASTPAGKNGPFYELYQKALYDEEFYVQQTTIYDAIEQGLTIDVNSLKTLCPDPDVFKQEYLCEFMSEYGSMIDT
jgi:phage FluMu gp28-like protein